MRRSGAGAGAALPRSCRVRPPLVLLLALLLLARCAWGATPGAVVCRYDCPAGRRCSSVCDADAAVAAALPLLGTCTPDDAGGRRCLLAAPACGACPDTALRRRRLADDAPTASTPNASAVVAGAAEPAAVGAQAVVNASAAPTAASLADGNHTRWLHEHATAALAHAAAHSHHNHTHATAPPAAAAAAAAAQAPPSRRDGGRGRYDAVRVYILTAAWDAARAVNAHAVCGALRAGTCAVVPGIYAKGMNESGLAALEAEGLVTRRPLPAAPAWLALVPAPLRPLAPEYPANQMLVSYRAAAALANTAGNARILRMMAAAAAAEGPAAAERTLYVYLEDDADLGDAPASFEERLLALAQALPRAWDVLSLTPAPRVCENSARLPWYDAATGLVRPRLAFSRTTAVVYSQRGVARLLAALPADNIVDLWYRRLMRQGKLAILLHCNRLVRIGAQAAQQA